MYVAPFGLFMFCSVLSFSAYIWNTNYSHVPFADTGVPIWLFARVFISAVFTRSSLPSSLLLLKPLFPTVIESYGNLVWPSLGNRFSYVILMKGEGGEENGCAVSSLPSANLPSGRNLVGHFLKHVVGN
jgi:hypothetical protein